MHTTSRPTLILPARRRLSCDHLRTEATQRLLVYLRGISLSLTNRLPAEVLVVEGWIGKNGVRGAVAHFRNGLLFLKELATFPWF
jgi:hypothetical protein